MSVGECGHGGRVAVGPGAPDAMCGRVYGENINRSLLDLIRPGPRVLDIGCGAGGWADELRARGVRTLVGVEVASASAAKAARRYDCVLVQPSECLTFADFDGPFDTIIAADVIEHLVDPFTELGRWREWVSDGGELVISTPNLRHHRVLRKLVLHGRFDYLESGGVMDRSHLRWFTDASLTSALECAGWRVERRGHVATGRSGHLNLITGQRLAGFLDPSLQLVCRVR